MRIPFIVSGFRHRAALLAVLWPLCATSYGQNDWKQYESEHFRIVGDADLDDTERIVADLEGFQAALEQFFRTTGMRSLPPATLLVLDGKGDLRRTGIEDGDQHFFVGPDRTFAVLTDAGNDEAFEDSAARLVSGHRRAKHSQRTAMDARRPGGVLSHHALGRRRKPAQYRSSDRRICSLDPTRSGSPGLRTPCRGRFIVRTAGTRRSISCRGMGARPLPDDA